MKKIQKILFALILLLPFIVSAKIIEADNNVRYEETEDSSKILAGNSINNSGDIDGIVFAAGNSINSKAYINYGFYAGNTITISDQVDKDIFVAGNEITITEDAILPRDVFIAGNSIKIYTAIGRDLYVGGSEVDLRGVIVKGNARIEAEKIYVDEDTIIEGTFTYFENVKIDNLDKATIGTKKTIKQTEANIGKKGFKVRIIEALKSSATAFVTLLVLFLLFPRFKKKIDETKDGASGIALTSLTGLAVLVVTPVLIILSMITLVLIPISLIATAAYVMSIYLSSIISYYLIGRLIYSKLSEDHKWVIELLIGLVLLKAISFIPIAGGIIVFICMLYGLGKLFSVFKASICK